MTKRTGRHGCSGSTGPPARATSPPWSSRRRRNVSTRPLVLPSLHLRHFSVSLFILHEYIHRRCIYTDVVYTFILWSSCAPDITKSISLSLRLSPPLPIPLSLSLSLSLSPYPSPSLFLSPYPSPSLFLSPTSSPTSWNQRAGSLRPVHCRQTGHQ